MFLETVETEGLAQLSYLVGDNRAGVCAVVDPRRDVETYLERAARRSVRIVAVIETHIHADFIAGSRALAARTGAVIRGGESAEYDFEVQPLADGERITLGALSLEAMHTPGHSLEHVSCLLAGSDGGPAWGVLTGDTLFQGSVGRPDLSTGTSPEELARELWRSLQRRLLPLGDEVIVYPGHGAGSPCGSAIGDRKTSTIGYERRHSEKLRAATEEEFVERVLGDLPEEPSYYRRTKRRNAAGPPLDGEPPVLPMLEADAFAERREADAIVVDAREIDAFAAAHLPGALNIALRPSFPIWAGWMLEADRPLLLILPDHAEPAIAARQLFRIGLDRVDGYLRKGMRGWIESGRPFRREPLFSVQELRERLGAAGDGLQLLDVRSASEWEVGRIPGAVHHHLPEVGAAADELDPDRPVAVYCGTGFRASLAASVLRRRGFERARAVAGSMEAWRAAGYPLDGNSAHG